MKLYLISQDENQNYDTYDSAVVAAENEKMAAYMNPTSGKPMKKEDWEYKYSSWAHDLKDVKVKYLGEATVGIEAGVICASFNAG